MDKEQENSISVFNWLFPELQLKPKDSSLVLVRREDESVISVIEKVRCNESS
jgi:hypothetical protein